MSKLICYIYETFVKLGNNSFTDWENSLSNFSFGTNKTPDCMNHSSLDQSKYDNLVFSTSQDFKDSFSILDNYNAAICILHSNEFYFATSGEARIVLIRVFDNRSTLIEISTRNSTTVALHGEKDLEESKCEHNLRSYNVKAQNDDLIIIGNLKLFSRISDTEIVEVINEHLSKTGFTEQFPQIIAKDIIKVAKTKNNTIEKQKVILI